MNDIIWSVRFRVNIEIALAFITEITPQLFKVHGVGVEVYSAVLEADSVGDSPSREEVVVTINSPQKELLATTLTEFKEMVQRHFSDGAEEIIASTDEGSVISGSYETVVERLQE